MTKRTKKFYVGEEGVGYPYKTTGICEDGRIRMVYLNAEPDTYFSHPGRCKIKGKSIRGFVTIKDDGETYFVAYKRRDVITDFELVRFGFDTQHVFPGIGIQGTRFRKVVCGVGTTEEAAFVSALDLIEQGEGVSSSWSNIEDQAGELEKIEADGFEEGEGKRDAWFYYGIRYNFDR